MSTLLVTSLLALVVAGEDAAAPKLDGSWRIAYAEEGGRRNNAWEQRLATVKGDSLTYEDAGKKQTMRLKFGPGQTVKATRTGEGGEDGKPASGVYIASQDYLCLSLEAPEGRSGAAARGSSGDFILILRKQPGTEKP